MSTVAYRDGIIAGDTRITIDSMANGRFQKVRLCLGKGAARAVVGVAGQLALAGPFMDWFERGADPTSKPDIPKDADFGGISVTIEQHAAGLLTSWESCLNPIVISAEFESIGSGSEIAIGAMAMGASALDAVRIACQHDINTGGPIWVADLVSGLYEMVR